MAESSFQHRLEIEKERRLWCRSIVTAQIYVTIVSLVSVHHLFNPFNFQPTFLLILSLTMCTLSTLTLIALCIFFCRPSKTVIRQIPVRKLTAASVETDPAFYIGGTV